MINKVNGTNPIQTNNKQDKNKKDKKKKKSESTESFAEIMEKQTKLNIKI